MAVRLAFGSIVFRPESGLRQVPSLNLCDHPNVIQCFRAEVEMASRAGGGGEVLSLWD